MSTEEVNVVTGAYGFTGKYIARRVLDRGLRVRTITNSLYRENPFGDNVQASPLCFDKPDELTKILKGATVLYNTYWIRFDYEGKAHATAVNNTSKLFECARQAGIERIIHISVTNPSEKSRFGYFRAKAQCERALKESGTSYCILRPGVIFGDEGILINNIAWVLRRFPLFGILGKGDYRVQPIYVDDLARLAVEEGQNRQNKTINAIGPENFTYKELVRAIAKAIGKERILLPVPIAAARIFSYLIGKMQVDIFATRQEIESLKDRLLDARSRPAGKTRLTDWMKAHSETLGRTYFSEIARRRDKKSSYSSVGDSSALQAVFKNP